CRLSGGQAVFESHAPAMRVQQSKPEVGRAELAQPPLRRARAGDHGLERLAQPGHGAFVDVHDQIIEICEDHEQRLAWLVSALELAYASGALTPRGARGFRGNARQASAPV